MQDESRRPSTDQSSPVPGLLTKELIEGLTANDVDILDRIVCAHARENFATFRRYMRPGMLWGWWNEDMANQFQLFYEDLVAGRRPKLAVMSPPQHGKTWTVEDFIAWVAGKNPDIGTIFASFSDELGVRTNLRLQRAMMSPRYRKVFAKTVIGAHGWKMDSSLIEYCGNAGGFRNTTVMGSINGMGLGLGVIDDPVKGRNEASSPTVRDKTWSWFTDDFLGRFSSDAGLIVDMTRWHVDDLLGRALEAFKDFRIVRYKAIATEDEPHRRAGEALFPELKPLDFLMERRRALTDASWESLYQQEPFIVGGGVLPIEKMKILNVLDRSQILHSVRYWDKAGTEGGGAFTSGTLMHEMSDRTYVIEDVVRGQWGALDRENRILLTANADSRACKNYEVGVEQEPGSGGKESAENTVRNLAGYRVFLDRVTGAKEVRAEPFAAQVQGGNVRLVGGSWVMPFISECESWPAGKYKDQVDSAAGAFSRLAVSRALPPVSDALAAWAARR